MQKQIQNVCKNTFNSCFLWRKRKTETRFFTLQPLTCLCGDTCRIDRITQDLKLRQLADNGPPLVAEKLPGMCTARDLSGRDRDETETETLQLPRRMVKNIKHHRIYWTGSLSTLYLWCCGILPLVHKVANPPGLTRSLRVFTSGLRAPGIVLQSPGC